MSRAVDGYLGIERDSRHDPSIEELERGVAALDDLADQVPLIPGASPA